MKWLIRTLVILVVAVIVSAATAWIAPSLMPNRNFPGGERRPTREQRPTNNNTANNPTPQRRERGERGGGLFGIVVVLRSLLEIAIVIVPFALYSNIKQRRKTAHAQLLS